MVKKFYAFHNFKTKENGIVDSWEKCLKKVKNISNIQYKKFTNYLEAETYIERLANSKEELENKDELIHFYVDGSYRYGKSEKSSWAWVAVQEENKIAEDSGRTNHAALSRNIDGEILATLKAVEWFFQKKNNLQFKKKNQEKIIICYDYAGIEFWAREIWKAKTEITIQYQNKIKEYVKFISFQKIKSHSNNQWNDYVDLLAKEQLS